MLTDKYPNNHQDSIKNSTSGAFIEDLTNLFNYDTACKKLGAYIKAIYHLTLKKAWDVIKTFKLFLGAHSK